MDLLPALEAFITQRITDLAKYHANPKELIRELEAVRSVCRGFQKQHDLLLTCSPTGQTLKP